MNKRLRKKKRLGEFREFGFKAGFRFSDQLTTEARNHLLEKFIKEAIEKNGLQYGGGGGGNEWNGFVALNKLRGSTRQRHRKAVERWFIHEAAVKEYYLTDMIDAWYGHLDSVDINWVRKA
ncbi:MAG: DUF469 family protein [Deltaproteobacteria bacterium]|nr:DUF469 family protein [Deltaproteobacteria bacterium]